MALAGQARFMPVIVATESPHLVVRRLGKEDLDGLAEVLPQALGGDVEPWTEDAWA